MSALAEPTETGEWKLPSPRLAGIVCLFITETALFTIFVVAYVFYIGKSLNPPYPPDVLAFPLIATICLLSSSVTVVIAETAHHRRKLAVFRIWWLITILLGIGFLAYTAHEWYGLIVGEGLYLSTNVFGTTFYSLVGLHASHVVVGLLLLSVILVASLVGKLEAAHHEHVKIISWYWHFVDVVWIVVLTVVYLISAEILFK